MAPKALKVFFEHQNLSNFFLPNTWQMMLFLNPLDVLIPKIQFSFFADFWVWVTSEAHGPVSVGFWGSRLLSPLGGGGVRLEGSIDPPPRREVKARPPKDPLLKKGEQVRTPGSTNWRTHSVLMAHPLCTARTGVGEGRGQGVALIFIPGRGRGAPPGPPPSLPPLDPPPLPPLL